MTEEQIREKKRKYAANRRKERAESGLCPRCGKPNDRDKYYCSECAKKHSEYTKETRESLRKLGLCAECGKVRVYGGYVTCEMCIARRANNKKSTTQEQQNHRNEQARIRYTKKKKNGICVSCGNKADYDHVKCKQCLAKEAEKKRIAHAKKTPYNIREYREENHLCYFCGKPIDRPGLSRICQACWQNQHDKAVENRKLRAESYKRTRGWKQDNKLIFKN